MNKPMLRVVVGTVTGAVAGAAGAAMVLAPPRQQQTGGVLERGEPGSISGELFLRECYATRYDRRTKNPLWTAERLTAEDLEGSVKRGNMRFKQDAAIPQLYQARLSDFKGSGFDRGHMVAAGDAKRSETAMQETFLLSNISPQVGAGFNRDYWERFERWCRELTRVYSTVFVITGPCYLPTFREQARRWYVEYEMIGDPPNVAVPTHFFKVILTEDKAGERNLSSFVIPNATIDDGVELKAHWVPLQELERATGLSFFDKITEKASIPPIHEHLLELPSPFRKKYAVAGGNRLDDAKNRVKSSFAVDTGEGVPDSHDDQGVTVRGRRGVARAGAEHS